MRAFIVACLFALGSTVPAPVGAESMTFYFGGTLTSVENSALLPPYPASVGDAFSGFYTFDTDTKVLGSQLISDGVAVHIFGVQYDLTSLSVSVGGLTFSGAGSISSSNSGQDSFSVSASPLLPPLPSSEGTFDLSLFDPSGSAFAAADSFQIATDLSAFSRRLMRLSWATTVFGATVAGHDLRGEVTYLSTIDPNVSPIPEPQTYAMLLAGLALLGFATRRRERLLAAA